jgi:hypothetical protein
MWQSVIQRTLPTHKRAERFSWTTCVSRQRACSLPNRKVADLGSLVDTVARADIVEIAGIRRSQNALCGTLIAGSLGTSPGRANRTSSASKARRQSLWLASARESEPWLVPES